MSGFVVASALALLSPGVAPPERHAWIVAIGLTDEQVGNRNESMRLRGYRPIRISAYNSVEANKFAVIYEQGAGPLARTEWGLTPDRFAARSADLRTQGYGPVCVSGCNQIGAERLAGVWLKGVGTGRELSRGLSAAALGRERDRMRGRGYRPVWVSSYMVDAANAYAAIWEKSDLPWELRYGQSAENFQETLDDLTGRGYRPLSISGLGAGGGARYSAVWEQRKGPDWQLRYGQTQEVLLEFASTMKRSGYRPTAVVGYNTLNGDRFASIWEKEAAR